MQRPAALSLHGSFQLKQASRLDSTCMFYHKQWVWQLSDLPVRLAWLALSYSLLPTSFPASSLASNCLPRTRASLFLRIRRIAPLCDTSLTEGPGPQLRRETPSHQPLAERLNNEFSWEYPGTDRLNWIINIHLNVLSLTSQYTVVSCHKKAHFKSR